jgi:DNA-directed DNA polymerase III PolC
MIIHLDADAFYASVEQAADPRLRGRPVAVGGTKRGVVASASYEARKLGVHTTMPTARAKKICPHLVVLPGDFDQYERFSRLMFSYAYDHTPVVEVASIDEGYFDLRGNLKRPAVEIAAVIRRAIAQTLKIPVSEGVAANKLVSAIASKLKKPSAFQEIQPGYEREFLDPLPNKWLPGVGPKLSHLLDQAGLVRIGQIACVPPDQLSLFAGSQAHALWTFSRGIDERPVIAEPPAAKSYSEQETFESDITDEYWVLAKLRAMADRLLAKTRADRKTIRTIEVRLRYNDFDECRRSESLREPTDLESDIHPVLARLMRKAWERRVSLRLVSVKLSNLYDAIFQTGLNLLDAGPDPIQRRRLSYVVDAIRARHGVQACMRGHDLYLQETERSTDVPPAFAPQQRAGCPRSSLSSPVRAASSSIRYRRTTQWIPLNFKSGYSFLNSLLTPRDIVQLAARRSHPAVAITDPNLHGAVEFIQAAKEHGIRPILGAELSVAGRPLCAYVRDRTGWQNLCALLSLPNITQHRLHDHSQGLILRPADHQPAIRYAEKEDRQMFRILSSIRTLTLLDQRSPEKSRAAFHYPTDFPGHDSLALADACTFELETGGLKFPAFHPPDGTSPHAFLRRITLEGACRRYGKNPSNQVLAQIEEELTIIGEVGYEDYFLLTWDLLWNDCHPRGIEWITRGSAADSLVCFCLGISDVCPIRFQLYFRRFLNRDRMALNKLPDIDLDFAHDRKDDVLDLLFQKYGDRAAIVGGFSTFQGRSAFADIAKVMGVSEYQIRRMTAHMPWHTKRDQLESAIQESQECRDGTWEEDPYRTALQLAARLHGMPRNAKMHPCGMVLSREPIATLTPLFTAHKGYPTTHFDMDAVEAIGLVKMDILAQGGLAVIRDTKRLLAAKATAVDLKTLAPWDNAQVWQMIASGGARGVHHIESPAMLSLSRMVGANNIDDLIAIVSVIRPGAANSLKKEQFARRAQGLDPVQYAHPSLEPVLASTYGVIAYEEHILQICEAFCDMPAGRSDILRRALVKCDQEKIIALGKEFVAHANKRGRTPEEIRAVWTLITGFQGYAFCRAHSTAYGIEAYEAAWLKCFHPLDFLACVLTHGKGFYNKLVYSIECRRLGIHFLPPDINRSTAVFQPESGAIRVPPAQIKGLSDRTLTRWEKQKPFDSLRDFYLRCQPSSDEMSALIRTGAFDGFGHSRTRQFWQFRDLAQWPQQNGQGLLFGKDCTSKECGRPARLGENAGGTPALLSLKEPSRLDQLRDEQELLGFPVQGHPLELFPDIAWSTYCPINRLPEYANQEVTVAGLIIEDRIHRQSDGRTMKFISLCDPTGILECELFADAYARFGVETVRHPVVEVTGKVTPFPSGLGFSLSVNRLTVPRKERRTSNAES